MGWPYYVCPTLVRVSMDSAGTLPRGYPWVGHTMYVQHWSEYPWNPRILCQRGIHGLAILCMSNVGQSIHGIHGYFAKGCPWVGYTMYVCPTLVRVSMESTDTLPKGYPWVGHTMYVQRWSEYPWNPRILCQGGIHGLAILCMSNIGQSIHGIRGYFAKRVSMGWLYYVYPTLVRVSMESADTLPRGYPWVGYTMYIQHWSEYPWNPWILCQGVSMGWLYYVCPTLVRVSMESADTLPRGYPWVGHTMYVQHWSEYPWIPRVLCQGGIHGLAILCMSNIGQSIHGIRGYFAKGVSMGWPYYVCPTLVRVSMESTDTLPKGVHGLAILCMYVQRCSEYPWNPRILCQGGIHGLALLCISNIGQSIHGIRGYFAKGCPWVGYTMYVCPTLFRVSMESTDTLPRGYPWVGFTMYIQHWSEYPWNPRILCQGGIHGLAILCISNIGQSIHGIRGYFAKGVSMGWPYYVCPRLVRVSMESADTLPRGYPWVGHTMYIQHWSEYPWNPRILCQGGIHGLAILCISNIGQSIHGIRGYLAKGVSMGWPYYVCPRLVRVSMESADTLPRGYPWVGHTMYIQHWSEYPWNPWILCQGGIHGLAILCMSNIGQSIHGIRGYFAKRVSMGWLYYVCTM